MNQPQQPNREKMSDPKDLTERERANTMSNPPVEYIELNLSNYDDDDVAQLNEWGVWADAEITSLREQVAKSQESRNLAAKVAAMQSGAIADLQAKLAAVEAERDELLELMRGGVCNNLTEPFCGICEQCRKVEGFFDRSNSRKAESE